MSSVVDSLITEVSVKAAFKVFSSVKLFGGVLSLSFGHCLSLLHLQTGEWLSVLNNCLE